jgi:HK97 family phage portal protein
MRIFGFEIARTKATQTLQSVESRGLWWPWPRVLESFSGAWQQNIEVSVTDALTYPTVWACETLIASDVAKLGVGLAEPSRDGIWRAVENPAYSPVLRKPNHYQTHIQFYEYWMLSKLTRGNTYVLKVRDNRQVVTDLYVLDPNLVRPLMAPDGSVFYDLRRDDLSLLPEEKIVPAREIIHDRFNCVYHPLVGLSPLHAAALAATQGLKIQHNTASLFANGANPGGILTAPGHIPQEAADRVKAYIDSAFMGAGVGKTLVLGDGLTYTPSMMNAVDSELVKQLNWSDEKICACYHVPAYMVGVGSYPSYNNVQALAQQYYNQCLQVLLESIEALLDEGLSLLPTFRSVFDLDSLLRMDSATLMTTIRDGVGAGVLAPNEGRNKLNYEPVKGGDTPYLQEQNWPLRSLSERELPTRPPTAPVPLPAPSGSGSEGDDSSAKFIAALHRKSVEAGLYEAA